MLRRGQLRPYGSDLLRELGLRTKQAQRGAMLMRSMHSFTASQSGAHRCIAEPSLSMGHFLQQQGGVFSSPRSYGAVGFAWARSPRVGRGRARDERRPIQPQFPCSRGQRQVAPR